MSAGEFFVVVNIITNFRRNSFCVRVALFMPVQETY